MPGAWVHIPRGTPHGQAVDGGPLHWGQHPWLHLRSTDKRGTVVPAGLAGKAGLPLCPRYERLCILSQTGYVPRGSKPVPRTPWEQHRAVYTDVPCGWCWKEQKFKQAESYGAGFFFPKMLTPAAFFSSGAPALLEKEERQSREEQSHFPPPTFDYS